MTIVLIAVDETDSSVRAVETAHRLFGDSAEYLVLNVGGGNYVPVPIFPAEMGMISPMAWAPVIPPEPSTADTREDGSAGEVSSEANTAETVAKLTGEEGGLPEATAIGIVGDPAGSIIDVALEHSADVIVVGTHERGWFTRLLSPSVADEVRRSSTIPVLFVPHADDDEQHH